jgi:hypothetical protein
VPVKKKGSTEIFHYKNMQSAGMFQCTKGPAVEIFQYKLLNQQIYSSIRCAFSRNIPGKKKTSGRAVLSLPLINLTVYVMVMAVFEYQNQGIFNMTRCHI